MFQGSGVIHLPVGAPCPAPHARGAGDAALGRDADREGEKISPPDALALTDGARLAGLGAGPVAAAGRARLGSVESVGRVAARRGRLRGGAHAGARRLGARARRGAVRRDATRRGALHRRPARRLVSGLVSVRARAASEHVPDAARQVLGYCVAHQDYEAGQFYGGLLLQQDRAHERTHRQLMRLHYRAGDRTAALRQHERCRAALREELGVEPDRRTAALCEQIRADRLAAPTPSTPPRAARTKPQSPKPAASRRKTCSRNCFGSSRCWPTLNAASGAR